MSSVKIRPAREADLPAITAIYDREVRENTATFELTPPDLAEMTRRFRALQDGDFPYLAATLDGDVLGVLALPDERFCAGRPSISTGRAQRRPARGFP